LPANLSAQTSVASEIADQNMVLREQDVADSLPKVSSKIVSKIKKNSPALVSVPSQSNEMEKVTEDQEEKHFTPTSVLEFPSMASALSVAVGQDQQKKEEDEDENIDEEEEEEEEQAEEDEEEEEEEEEDKQTGDTQEQDQMRDEDLVSKSSKRKRTQVARIQISAIKKSKSAKIKPTSISSCHSVTKKTSTFQITSTLLQQRDIAPERVQLVFESTPEVETA
jgi:hypothetical protein